MKPAPFKKLHLGKEAITLLNVLQLKKINGGNVQPENQYSVNCNSSDCDTEKTGILPKQG